MVLDQAKLTYRVMELRSTKLEADQFYRRLGFEPTDEHLNVTHRLELQESEVCRSEPPRSR